MKAKQLAEVWQAAETEQEISEAMRFITKEFISEIEYKIGQQQASTHEEVITILEQMQKKWNALTHRVEGLPEHLFHRMIAKYDAKMFEAWMAKKN